MTDFVPVIGMLAYSSRNDGHGSIEDEKEAFNNSKRIDDRGNLLFFYNVTIGSLTLLTSLGLEKLLK